MDRRQVSVDHMACANEPCKQLVVRFHDSYIVDNGTTSSTKTDTSIGYPRDRVRQVDPHVPEEFARDFIEAAAILDRSHRMSAVLARRVLSDLLEKYANLGQFSLTTRIDKFIDDTNQPRSLRENLHHLREIADFSAHTQRNDGSEVLDVTREEAEWTLDVVSGCSTTSSSPRKRTAPSAKASTPRSRRLAGRRLSHCRRTRTPMIRGYPE